MNRSPLRKISTCERAVRPGTGWLRLFAIEGPNAGLTDSPTPREKGHPAGTGVLYGPASGGAAGRFAADAEPSGRQPVWLAVGARPCFYLHRTDFDFAFGIAG
jgi:hypothetical protein